MKRTPIYAYNGWYPSSKNSLLSMFEQIKIKDVKTSFNESSIKGIISPHAGYVYSLKTAFHSFSAIKGNNYDNIFIFGSSHHSSCEGKAVFSDYDAFETPIGSLEVNNALIMKILNKFHDLFFIDNDIHLNEHSLEMQIPLIKYFLGDVKIVPLILPPSDILELKVIGEAISEFITKDSLIVISTDLSHFPTKSMAEEIDKDAMNSWVTLNPKFIWDTEEKWRKSKITSCSMCGISAITAGIYALNKSFKNLKVELIDHSTSYDFSNDDRRVVGYGSAVIYIEK